MRLSLVPAALAVLAAFAPSASAARPVTIAPAPSETIPTRPLLVDLTATIPVKGRAAPRTPIDVSARCSLRPCVTRVYANRKGHWRAQLHVVVPPSRRVLFVRAGEAVQQVTLAAPTEPATGTPEFALIGDSLAQGIEPYLPEALPDWRVTVDAARSRFLLDGMAVRETMRKPRRPVVLAFSLFTNDDPRRANELAAWARQSVVGLPEGSCVLWATIARPKVGGVSYAEANRQLELAAAEVPGLVIIHWAEAVREHRRWLREDRVHATAEGYRARAELYAAAARTCPLGR